MALKKGHAVAIITENSDAIVLTTLRDHMSETDYTQGFIQMSISVYMMIRHSNFPVSEMDLFSNHCLFIIRQLPYQRSRYQNTELLSGND